MHRIILALVFILAACSVTDGYQPTPTPDPTPTQEAQLYPVRQCLDLSVRMEPLRQLSANPCLEGAYERVTLIDSAEDVRHQHVPSGFTGIMLNNPRNDCFKGWHVFPRELGGNDPRGFRADISEVCGRFGYRHPSIPVECNRNLVLKMTTWSSFFDKGIGDKPSWTGLIMTVYTPNDEHELALIGIPNSGFSGNIRVIRFEGCERTNLVFDGVIDVVWASSIGHVTIQGLEVLQPEDRLYGNDIVRVIQVG